MTKKIVITGGPGTGKTTLLKYLVEKGYSCFEEISRKITQEAREEGIEHLFLQDPLLFSKKVIDERSRQFEASNAYDEPLVFFDRGIPDVLAYMDFVNESYPEEFNDRCRLFRYDKVVMLSPWLEIYANDHERYESFAEAQKIHFYLQKAYEQLDYSILQLPQDTVEKRADFLLESLNL